MNLLQDIITTYKISRNPGSNWRAIHAMGGLIVGVVIFIAALFFLALDWPELIRTGVFTFIGIAFLMYWRILLPEASRISEIKRILSHTNE